MATTRKMSVDNAEGLLEAVRSHTTKRHEGVVRWYTEKKHYGFIEAPGAAATDLFVHASEVTEPLRAGDKVSFVIGERRGRSAATKVEVLERAPPPPPRVFTPVAFGGQQAGFALYQPYGYAGEVPEPSPSSREHTHVQANSNLSKNKSIYLRSLYRTSRLRDGVFVGVASVL